MTQLLCCSRLLHEHQATAAASLCCAVAVHPPCPFKHPSTLLAPGHSTSWKAKPTQRTARLRGAASRRRIVRAVPNLSPHNLTGQPRLPLHHVLQRRTSAGRFGEGHQIWGHCVVQHRHKPHRVATINSVTGSSQNAGHRALAAGAAYADMAGQCFCTFVHTTHRPGLRGAQLRGIGTAAASGSALGEACRVTGLCPCMRLCLCRWASVGPCADLPRQGTRDVLLDCLPCTR